MSKNIVFSEGGPLRQLSNLAASPFEIEGRRFGSFEGFWNGHKFPLKDAWREPTFLLWGDDARQAGLRAQTLRTGGFFPERGGKIFLNDPARFRLAAVGLIAKFIQHAPSRTILLETGDEELTHVLVHPRTGEPFKDSEILPARIFCKQLMKIRSLLQNHPAHGERYLKTRVRTLAREFWAGEEP